MLHVTTIDKSVSISVGAGGTTVGTVYIYMTYVIISDTSLHFVAIIVKRTETLQIIYFRTASRALQKGFPLAVVL